MRDGRYEPDAAQFWGPRGGALSPGRRLLLLSYHFPPGQSVGALRWQQLSSHAAEHGWGLDVITLHPSSVSDPDMSRLASIPPGTRVYGIRAPTLQIERIERVAQRVYRTRHFEVAGPRPGSRARHEVRWSRKNLVDELRRAYYAWAEYRRQSRWAEAAARLGARLLERGVHRAVVSCGPPHMVHEAARRLADAKGLPLVIDLRDPWSLLQRIPEPVASPLWYSLAARYERRAVAEAALIVMNTESARRAMQAAYPAAAERIIAVMNGHDYEPVPRSRHGHRFTIAYAGTIYLDRDPRPLFRATAEVVRRLDLSPDELGIELMGKAGSFNGMPVEALARGAGIEAFVRVRPPGPLREAMEFLADAAVLLSLPQDSDMAIPSKIFEYMQFEAWVLALASPGSATELLLRDSGADVIPPDDEEAIARSLETRYRQYRRGERPPRLAESGRYGRLEQGRRLFDAINHCIGATVPDSKVTSPPAPSPIRRLKRRIDRIRILRRMQVVARRPDALAVRIARARTIHFVCQGNIIRSPFAEAALRERIRDRTEVEVSSSGLWFGGGGTADPRARESARQFGVDLASHVTRRLGRAELLATDVVFAMEADHLVEIERRFPECAAKAYLLGCLAPDGPLEIDDPLNAPIDVLEDRLRRIDAAVSRVAELVLQGASASTD
jgi:protein-tyrosine-phosphatase